MHFFPEPEEYARPYTLTALPLRMSRILRSFSRVRSRHQNVKFCVSVNKLDVSQYSATACETSNVSSPNTSPHEKQRTEGARPATGIKATLANRNTFVTIR